MENIEDKTINYKGARFEITSSVTLIIILLGIRIVGFCILSVLVLYELMNSLFRNDGTNEFFPSVLILIFNILFIIIVILDIKAIIKLRKRDIGGKKIAIANSVLIMIASLMFLPLVAYSLIVISLCSKIKTIEYSAPLAQPIFVNQENENTQVNEKFDEEL